jgi:hypothetical protein
MLGNNSMIMAVGYTNLKWHGTMQNHILCPWKQEGKRGHSEVKSYLANKIELHVFQCQSRREVKMNARRSRTRTRRRPGAVRAGGRGRWWKAAAGRVAPETPIQPCAFPAPGCCTSGTTSPLPLVAWEDEVEAFGRRYDEIAEDESETEGSSC